MAKPSIKDVILVHEDERGSILRHVMKTEETLIIIRKPGTVSGKHYHGGADPVQNPEIIILLTGAMDLFWKDMETEETGTEKVVAPAEISIPKMVYHEFKFAADSVMLEPHALLSDRKDTHWPKNI